MAAKRVLVVDDEPDVVTLIARTLVTEGFEVVTAYDGIAALDIAETESPDIVLLDVMMPMMSGYEVCQQIKANPQTQHIPVIFLTSAHSPDARNKSRAAGGDTLVMKPFSAAELVAQINRSLGQPAPE